MVGVGGSDMAFDELLIHCAQTSSGSAALPFGCIRGSVARLGEVEGQVVAAKGDEEL